jgi:hypothetical protein
MRRAEVRARCDLRLESQRSMIHGTARVLWKGSLSGTFCSANKECTCLWLALYCNLNVHFDGAGACHPQDTGARWQALEAKRLDLRYKRIIQLAMATCLSAVVDIYAHRVVCAFACQRHSERHSAGGGGRPRS